MQKLKGIHGILLMNAHNLFFFFKRTVSVQGIGKQIKK